MADTLPENFLILVENRQEGSVEAQVASRFVEMADSFLQSKLERLRQDGELYKKMIGYSFPE